MEVVEGQVFGEHVVVLALDGEGAAVDNDALGGGANDAEVAGFFGKDFEVQGLDEFLGAGGAANGGLSEGERGEAGEEDGGRGEGAVEGGVLQGAEKFGEGGDQQQDRETQGLQDSFQQPISPEIQIV